MQLDEHRSKLLFETSGLPVPPGIKVVCPPESGAHPAPPFPGPWYVKALVAGGGRGKAGGVLRAEDADELAAALSRLGGMRIGGELVRIARIEPAVVIERELYLSFAVSRDAEALMLTVGRKGGVDVEQAHERHTLSLVVDQDAGPEPHQIRRLFFHLGLERELYGAFRDVVADLFGCVRDNGLLLAEVNPLAVTAEGLLALDGKVEVDSAMIAARPVLDELYEPLHHTPEENKARAHNLAYVAADGFVGVMANGAGLAMASMDACNLAGLPAANFLDLGGGATEESMRAAFTILFEDERIACVFINLYGGILSCAGVARAMLAALDGRPPARPLVVRFAGNGAEQGVELLENEGLPGLHLAPDMAVALAKLAELSPRLEEPARIEAVEEGAKVVSLEESVHAGTPAEPLRLDETTPILVQGATGRTARRHIVLMRGYGANLVAGVTPFKGGGEAEGLPVYDTVADAAGEHVIGASVVFVPGPFAADAVEEAASAGIPLVVCITDGVPQLDMLRLLPKLEAAGTRLIGPNCPGLIVPGRTRLGIMPADPFTPGSIAVFSRSGTLTYEASSRLSAAGYGQAWAIGIGGDPFVGTRFTDCLAMAAADDRVEAVLAIGEIGGRAEEDLAAAICRTGFAKPVFAFVAGMTAPRGKRLGHAGAILDEASGGVRGKLTVLAAAGVHLAGGLNEIAPLVRRVLG
jgi:succinyl-CoA synthetase alpha subunit